MFLTYLLPFTQRCPYDRHCNPFAQQLSPEMDCSLSPAAIAEGKLFQVALIEERVSNCSDLGVFRSLAQSGSRKPQDTTS